MNRIKTLRINKLLKAKYFLAVLLILAVVGTTVKLVAWQAANSSALDDSQIKDINTTQFAGIIACLDKPQTERNVCFEQFLRKYGEDKEIAELLQEMEDLRTVDQTIESQCHPISHAIGREALRRYETVGDAFRSCNFSCYSGCYHGVMERLFFTESEIQAGQNHLSLKDLQERLPGVCDRSQFENPTPAIIFQCLHGSGHAVLYTLGYNLRDGLKACDSFETEYEQASCYGGVFMENITAFDRELRDLSETDPLYPCNSVDDKYKSDCYLLQTSRMLEMGLSYEEMGELCLKAGNYKRTCFMSFGRDATGFIKGGEQFSKVAELCENPKFTESDVQGCVSGVTYLLMDDPNGFKNAFKFCNSLSTFERRENCYADSIPYAADIYNKTPDDLSQQCELYAAELTASCVAYASGEEATYL